MVRHHKAICPDPKSMALRILMKQCHVDLAVFDAIKDLADNKFKGGNKVYDLKSGRIGLSDMKFTKDKVGKENLEKIKAVSEKIVKGDIKVPSTLDELAKYEAKIAKK